MDTRGLIESLRGDLLRTAEMGGEDVRSAAERLLTALEPAIRLTLMEALSQAAAEIGSAAPEIQVDVRLNGREPEIVVTPSGSAARDEEAWDADPGLDEDEVVARITLRLPETLKTRAEALAARRGQSLNAWLVAAARAAASDGPGPARGARSGGSGRRLHGWVR
jgi:hypothetical protein